MNTNFIVAWSNLLPELYGNSDPNRPPPPQYSPEHLRSLPEGAGGGNIRAYFCTPRGHIVHLSIGYWKPERFLDEARFALALAGSNSGEVTEAQTRRRQELEAQRQTEEKELPAKPAANDPAVRKVGELGLRLRAAEDVRRDLLADIVEVLDRRREEVYTKGAVG